MFNTYYEKNRFDIKSLFSSLTRKGDFQNHKKIVKTVLRGAVFLGIVLYLVTKLSSIGWANIIQSLPSSPVFYLLSVAFVKACDK